MITKQRPRIIQLVIFAVLTGIFFTSCSKTKEIEKPNIIFIMCDDHAFQAISAYGSELIETPNIDRLANEGMRFDKAFVTNSICSPSRAVILTGKHSHMNGLYNNSDVFDSTQQTFPKILQKAGYKTAIVGKWHLKSEPTGFDYWKVLPGQGYYYNPEFRTQEGIVTEMGYVSDLITDFSISWLDSLSSGDEPFMLMYHHKAPHREWWPSLDHIKDFTGKTFPEPSTLFDDYQGRGSAAKQAEMRISDHMGLTNDNKIHPDSLEKFNIKEFYNWYHWAYRNNYNRMTEEEQSKWDAVYNPIIQSFMDSLPNGKELTRWKYQRYIQDYLASIKSVDENVGRLLNYLDETGIRQNTVVVYTSDQGFYLGEHGWFDKRFMYEESFRTPLLIRWPQKIKPGSVNNDLVQNLDFAETFLEIAGLEIPEDMQGRSLAPLFEGNNQDWRDAIYYHYYEYPGIHAVKRHYGIRTERYKLIHFYDDIDEWELYDLENDPQEMRNIIDDPQYDDIKKKLLEKLEQLEDRYQV